MRVVLIAVLVLLAAVCMVWTVGRVVAYRDILTWGKAFCNSWTPASVTWV